MLTVCTPDAPQINHDGNDGHTADQCSLKRPESRMRESGKLSQPRDLRGRDDCRNAYLGWDPAREEGHQGNRKSESSVDFHFKKCVNTGSFILKTVPHLSEMLITGKLGVGGR